MYSCAAACLEQAHEAMMASEIGLREEKQQARVELTSLSWLALRAIGNIIVIAALFVTAELNKVVAK